MRSKARTSRVYGRYLEDLGSLGFKVSGTGLGLHIHALTALTSASLSVTVFCNRFLQLLLGLKYPNNNVKSCL